MSYSKSNINKEVTPKQIEEATMEIIKDSMKILKDYNLMGSISFVEIGLISVHAPKSTPKHEYDITYNGLFSLRIKLRQRG